MLPPRTPKKPKRASRWKSPAHRQWVRTEFACCACHGTVNRQFAHNRKGTECGIGQKPDDWHGIVLCGPCHQRQHEIGEESFDRETGMDRHALATEFAAESPKAHEIARIRREREDA